MLAEHLKLLLDYWIRPAQAASHTLDHGRLGIAAVLALTVALLLQFPAAKIDRGLTQKQSHAAIQQRLAHLEKPDVLARVTTLAGIAPRNSIRFLLLLAALFTPFSIAILSKWEGLPRTGMSIQQNFAGLLCALLFAFTASHLPAALAGWFVTHPIIDLASHAWFLVLAAFSLRTIVGGGLLAATGSAATASAATAGVTYLATATGLIYMLGSPFILFFAWLLLRGEWSRLSGGLGQQQSFRRHLEALTLNPRDADAHYQLGLLYLARKDLPKAADRFRQAAEIDGDDADYAYQYGRLLREQGQVQESLNWLQKAARLNDKTASNEVWRELGAAHISLGNLDQAIAALGAYVQRREYDPEGLVLYGRALHANGRHAEARQAFERAIEAVKTMPDHRRRQLRHWADAAKQELSRG